MYGNKTPDVSETVIISLKQEQKLLEKNQTLKGGNLDVPTNNQETSSASWSLLLSSTKTNTASVD